MFLRKSYLLYAMGAGLAFGACSSEETLPQEGNVVEKSTSFYVNVSITTNSDMGTRAGSEGYDGTGNPDFEKGEASESVVNTVYFVFYDDAGVVVGQPVLVPVDAFDNVTSDSENGSVLRSYTSIVQVDVNRGESLPTQVMCYVNPVSQEGLANSLQNVETVTREEFQGEKNGFSMSNSVYYATDETGQTLTRAVSIKDGQLFKSMEEAENAVAADENAARVVINVERYAAKVNFEFAKDDVVSDYVPANTDVTLTFVPEKWDVNATDRTTFVTKAFRSDGGLGSPAGSNMTYGEVNAEIARNDNWNWNSYLYSRSYWGFSPSYYSVNFPSIAYDVMNNEDKFYSLDYLTFDDIIGKGKVPSSTATHVYAKETTVSHRGLTSSNPAAAIASAVLAGHYVVSLNGTEVKDSEGKDLTFYTMGVDEKGVAQVFFNATLENGNIVSEVTGAPTMIEYMVNKETVLLVRNNADNTYEPLSSNNLARVFDALEIVRPSDAVYDKLGSHSASRTVTLQIGDLSKVEAGYTLCINVGNGAQEIFNGTASVPEGKIALVDANATLARATQWANRYNEGRAFFNIPIRHLGWYAGTNPNKDASNSSIDYSKARVGDFGLVRNHVYNININSITGLGTAVSEPEEPIVPPVETQDYFVAYRLNILNWAIVPVQDVDL